MFFYFSKLWFWWLLAIVLAAVLTAWLCRRLSRPRKPVIDERHVRELADARAAASRHETKVNELLSLRARDLDELTVARAQLGRADGLQGRLRSMEAEAGAVPSLEAEIRALRVEADKVRPLQDETVVLRRQIGDLQADNNRLSPLQARLRDLEGELAAARAERPLDTSGARAVLGRAVKADDLKVVEGIGPKIDELLRADGITTWRQLADAPAERLRGVLDAAGPRFQIHDPGTWPEQAALLGEARWEAFKALTDRLKGGRT